MWLFWCIYFSWGNITVTVNNHTDVALRNCATLVTCKIEINDVFIDKENHVCITMPMYKLIQYSDIII